MYEHKLLLIASLYACAKGDSAQECPFQARDQISKYLEYGRERVSFFLRLREKRIVRWMRRGEPGRIKGAKEV
jgi:hypothetical protein